jgi:hypothetical protein
LKAFKEDFETKLKSEKEEVANGVLGEKGEESRMTADINLMSKMPSYLRPFSN